MNNNYITDTHYYKSNNDSISLFKIYFIIRCIFMFVMLFIGIIICFAMFDIAKELQHIAYHLADGTCCSLYF